ncbi:BTB/POZ protein [Rhizophagus clarus]|uniref:BTB/POZ protein n=1 Tax=Rhizophagus clarus TaxID=94130 RepID=A0A8H3M4D7_9GLOM|nr:BTB/POZ protein [Rhizophagus clarus]
MSCGFLQKLSQNLLEILDDEEYYDITIEVGNDPHKNDDTLIQIKLPNILPEIFQIILRYIYGGEPSLKDCDNLDIIKILVTASELNLEEFYDLTSKEFLDGVLPYREILPDQLYMDLLKTFLSLHPNSKPTHKSNPRNRIVKEVLPNSLTIDEFNTDQAPDSWDKPRQTASPSKNVDDLLDYLFSTNQASEWNKPRQPGCDKPRQTASILNSMDQDCISWNKQHQTASVLNIMDQDCSWGKQHQSAINMEVDDSWDKPRQTATVLNNMDQDYRDKPHQIATIYNSMDQDCSWNKPRQTAKSRRMFKKRKGSSNRTIRCLLIDHDYTLITIFELGFSLKSQYFICAVLLY